MKNYSLKIFVLLIFFSTFWRNLNAQYLYISSSESQGIKSFSKDFGIGETLILYQNLFVTGDRFDEKKLITAINKYIPNKNSSGMAVLDWEGSVFNDLTRTDSRGKIARNQFTQAIRIAKKLRPNYKWSYYALPTRDFWKLDKEWRDKNLKIISFYKELDFLTPSLYVFYSFEEVNIDRQFRYIDENLKLAKQIANRLNIPVYPMINHRFHPSNKYFPNELLPNDIFTKYYQRIKLNNVEGIIWWQSEEYNYNISKNNELYKKDYKNMTKDKAHYQMFKSYIKNIEI